MNIGLYDPEKGFSKFPNLPLMKISAFHKEKGDDVEWGVPLMHYDRVYISKVFGDEYSHMNNDVLWDCDEIILGGTGYAIKIKDGKEVYEKNLDIDLPHNVEHVYPDYSLYKDITKNTAFGFLTRGCPNNCPFCIVSQKEGLKSVRVATLDEFWKGQKNIKLLDANTLACKEKKEILKELVDSRAWIDFTQGVDARLINEEIAEVLAEVKTKRIHFAFDLMKNEKQIIKGLKMFKKYSKIDSRNTIVYILTNFNTTHEEDLYRINAVEDAGYTPDVRIYRKETAPKITRYLQRWCNNRILYRSTSFEDFVPLKNGKTIKDMKKDWLL